MLNPQQTAIADYLLKYLESKGGKSSRDDYPEKLHAQNFDHWECNYTTLFLINQIGLIDYFDESKYYIALTANGYHAAAVGLTQYFNEIEQDKELDRAAKKSSIDGVRSAKLFSRISLAISIIAIMVSIFAIWQNSSEKKNIGSHVNNSSNGQSNRNSTRESGGFDSITNENFKHSLKHDSVFLNEIKQLIIDSDHKITLSIPK